MRGNEMAGTMHLTITERMIYSLVQHEVWDGDVEAPCGAYIGLSLEDRERYLIDAATEQETAEYWVVQEDSNGNLWFNPCDSFDTYKYYLAEKLKEYDAWDDAWANEIDADLPE